MNTSKEALTYSLSHELSATTMLISIVAKENTRASILPFGFGKSQESFGIPVVP